MLTTYRAKLRGNHIEWSEDTPLLSSHDAAEVYVTFVSGNGSEAIGKAERGARMKGALDKLAAKGGISNIPDPSAWQREVREDRPLPGHEN